jgi:SAM-dependent methyltransferase
VTVFIGPSIWREINVRTAVNLFVAMSQNPTDEPVIFSPIWNDALIGRSRSLMCTEFLKTDADVMVIIDDDIVFEPADFWKIVEGCRETRSVYGGAYVTRSVTPHITSRAWPGTEAYFGFTPNRRPVEYQYLATGFFALHRDVLEALIDAEIADADGTHKVSSCTLGADRPFYPFFMPYQVIEYNGARHYLSEDWAFCNAAAQRGFKIWVDQSIILQHMGLYPYTVADINNPGSAFPSTGIDVATFTGEPQVFEDDLVGGLLRDIAEFAEEDEGDVRRMVDQGPADTARLFREKPEGETEAEWYQREDVGLAYICDLANWHRRGFGVNPALADKLAGKRVLDYGCGIGTFALQAARAGTDVVCYEPNPVMREFTAWRAEKHGLSLTVEDAPPRGTFDAVVCWHVFEHLEHPEEVLDDLLAQLRPDGLAIFDDGFDDQNTPQHHAHHDWTAVLAARGLRAVDECVYQRERVAEAVLT